MIGNLSPFKAIRISGKWPDVMAKLQAMQAQGIVPSEKQISTAVILKFEKVKR